MKVENTRHYITESLFRLCSERSPSLTAERTFRTIWDELLYSNMGMSIQPRFSISPLLRLFNRLNLREKNQKLFVNVE